MKLTAQFVARNGSKFLNGLRAREARNPQFDFLLPEHPFFAYFQLLVEAYVHVLNPPVKIREELSQVLHRLPTHISASFHGLVFILMLAFLPFLCCPTITIPTIFAPTSCCSVLISC